MRRLRRITKLFIFWVLVALHAQALSTEIGDAGHKHAKAEKEKLSIAKIVMGAVSLLRKSHEISWIKIKTIMNNMQLQFFPPDLDFRSRDDAIVDDQNNAGSKVKRAVKKSFGTSKVAVEETAKSAAEVVGKAVRKTAEKVKENISDEDEGEESKSEL
ncbi:uncharacterized protein LOC115683012 isoform X2 [Syzygium oleosum]|uniref:uncharacterized protein LOC115683012 isoform X2 n=1 Tax=Syzygium oleosum TaxID=219896 RepID=UPI0011D1DDC9|nr:uncharacterized protein LOC115683012 isoform X2 [Syzygium oleosum]